MRMPLTIEGRDFSDAANRFEYFVTYEERRGNNGGVMLNGDETVDVLARKAVISWPLNDLNGSVLASIYSVATRDLVSVLFWDPRINGTRTGTFHPVLGGSKVGFRRADGVWWHGPVLTLRER